MGLIFHKVGTTEKTVGVPSNFLYQQNI